MKRFRFPLESVRTLREHKEREAQQHYAAAIRASEEAARRLQVLTLEMESCWGALREQLVALTSVAALAHGQAYAAVLEERRRHLAAALLTARERVEQAWRSLAGAARDRSALEHYRTRLLLRHRGAAQMEEQKHLDEVGGHRAVPSVCRLGQPSTLMD
jgi:flagellar export protein FliJ